ncbi:MAG: tetratricopeptide repeat protein [Gammaproteobacteria bacterium]|nr:tetratricopeptide repeat protein [Gammaproteobacteria bacterium]
MITTKSVGVLAGLFCLLLWPAHAVAQPADWERHLRAGEAAYEQGYLAEAVKQTKAALSLAEAFGPDDPRLATTLTNLALFYKTQGKSAEAEPLYQRALAIFEKALAIFEKALGSEHPLVALSLGTW